MVVNVAAKRWHKGPMLSMLSEIKYSVIGPAGCLLPVAARRRSDDFRDFVRRFLKVCFSTRFCSDHGVEKTT